MDKTYAIVTSQYLTPAQYEVVDMSTQDAKGSGGFCARPGDPEDSRPYIHYERVVRTYGTFEKARLAQYLTRQAWDSFADTIANASAAKKAAERTLELALSLRQRLTGEALRV